MPSIKLTLAYDGSAYAGWQVQSGQATLQGTLEATLAKITGEAIRVAASGRTDAGVHALGQVVSFSTASQLPADVLQRALNAELPRDMVVVSSVEAADGFHARRDAVRKRYRYTIEDGPLANVFRRHFVWHFRSRLDEAAMHRAAQALAGRHDFASFETAGSGRETSVRTIYEISVRRGSDVRRGSAAGQGAGVRLGGDLADEIDIEVEADGFLYNMVRTIVGTLVEVGRGTRGDSWPAEVLAAADRKAAGQTAPPQGLCLVSVEYGEKRTMSDER